MSLKLLLLLVVFILIAYFVIRPRRRTPEADLKSTSRIERQHQIAAEATPFHAVSIEPGDNACRAAQELKGKRILSSEAPSLPLPDCTLVDCQCHFRHHQDRRSHTDRRSLLPRGSSGDIDETGRLRVERRSNKDRRKSEDDSR